MPGVVASVGRVRVTSVPSPSEAAYIQSMRTQMAQIGERLQAIVDRVINVTPEAIKFGLQPIYDKSQELVPVDTGKLKQSGFVEAEVTRSGNPRGVIGYGRYGDPHYAAFVHEMVHIAHAKGKSAKFLEYAVDEKIGVFFQRMSYHMTQNAGLK